MNVLAIIPARRGSKEIQNKNMRLLGGKPLIQHTIDAACESNTVSRIIITTDCPSVQHLAEEAGLEVRVRPEHLARDDSRIEGAIKDVLDQCERLPEAIAVLSPTSPFRSAFDIDSCIEILRSDKEIGTVLGAAEMGAHPYKMLLATNNGVEACFDRMLLSENRQTLPKNYAQAGGIVVTRTPLFFESGILFNGVMRPYVFDGCKGIDIDSSAHFELAEEFITPS